MPTLPPPLFIASLFPLVPIFVVPPATVSIVKSASTAFVVSNATPLPPTLPLNFPLVFTSALNVAAPVEASNIKLFAANASFTI